MATRALERERSSGRWTVLALLWGVALLNYLDRQIIFAQLPLIQRDLHASSLELGFVGASFLWAYAIASPFAGNIADRFGRARMVVASLFVWSAATWLTAHVGSIGALLGSRVLMGISESFYLPAALALLANLHGPRTRALAVGIHQSGLYAGIILGGTGGGWVGETHGWRWGFTVLGIAGTLYTLLCGFLLLRGQRDETNRATSTQAFGVVLRSRGFIPLALAFGAVSISNWMTYTRLPLFLQERFHLTLTQAGFSATFYIQAFSFVGIFIAALASDRMSARHSQARVWVQTLGLILTAPLLFPLSWQSSLALLPLTLSAIGILRPWFDVNTMPVLKQLMPGEVGSTAYGLLNLSGCFFGGLAAVLAGGLKDSFGLGAAYQAAGVALVLGAGALFWMTRQEISFRDG